MVLVRISGLLGLLALSLISDLTPVNAQTTAPVATPSPAIDGDRLPADQPGSTRSRAEARAGAASEQFGRVLDKQDSDRSGTQSAGETGSALTGPSSPASGGLSASPRSALADAVTWLGKASDDYQTILLRLSRPLGPNPVIEAARKLERDRQANVLTRPTSTSAPEELGRSAGISDWVSRTASEYQREVVSRLAGLPPAALAPSQARAAGEGGPAKPSSAPASEAARPSEAVNEITRPMPVPPKADPADDESRKIAEIRRSELERKAAEAARLAGRQAPNVAPDGDVRKAVETVGPAEVAPMASQMTGDGKRSGEQPTAPDQALGTGTANVDQKPSAVRRETDTQKATDAGQINGGRRTPAAAANEHARLAREAAERITEEARRSKEALATAEASRAEGSRALIEARRQAALSRTSRHPTEPAQTARKNAIRAAERSRELDRLVARARRAAIENTALSKQARADAQLAADAAAKIGAAGLRLERAKTGAERNKAHVEMALEQHRAAEASRRVLALRTMPAVSEAGEPPSRAGGPPVKATPGAKPVRSAALRPPVAPSVASGRCRAAGLRARTPGWYTVRRGDSLWRIAVLHYREASRWQAIRRANTSLRTTRVIRPCQRLFIPR